MTTRRFLRHTRDAAPDLQPDGRYLERGSRAQSPMAHHSPEHTGAAWTSPREPLPVRLPETGADHPRSNHPLLLDGPTMVVTSHDPNDPHAAVAPVNEA